MDTIDLAVLQYIKPYVRVAIEGSQATIHAPVSFSEFLGNLYGEPHILPNGDLLYVSEDGSKACILTSKTLRSGVNSATFKIHTEKSPVFKQTHMMRQQPLLAEFDFPELHQAS